MATLLDSSPAWLKTMEHGSLGEVKTKAFLLDRFWVLERSVDIDGADFLIQKRSLGVRFTDIAPPKLGVVQAKFFQDRGTTHHIPVQYVLDENGSPLPAFFAVLHIGKEDASEMYLLSAADIVRDLARSKTDNSKFVVGAKALKSKFKITNRTLALDRIEHEVKGQTIPQAIRALDQLNIPYRKIDVDDIDFCYTLPLPNSQIDIPKGFADYKKQLQSVLWDMEEVIGVIDAILVERDPRSALDKLRELDDHRDHGGRGDQLVFAGFRTDLDWTYFEDGIKEHDSRLVALEEKELAEAYVDLARPLKEKIGSDVAVLPVDDIEGKYLAGRLTYATDTLKFTNFECSISEKSEKSNEAGQILMSVYLHNPRPASNPLGRAADALWYGMMSAVLRNVCPESFDEED